MSRKIGCGFARRRSLSVFLAFSTTVCCCFKLVGSFGLLPAISGQGSAQFVGGSSPAPRNWGVLTGSGRVWPQSSSGCRARARSRLLTCRVASPRKYGSRDWLTNMQNLPKSRLLYNIRHHLLFNTGFAFLVSLVHALTPQHIIDDLHVSPIPHSIMSGALGLLLVFRTNAAYNRFWEARKVWGNVVNVCRSITRLGLVSFGANSAEWREFKEYLKLFPFLLKQHLHNERNDLEVAFSTLPSEKLLAAQEDPNPPLFVCQMMSEIVARAYSSGGSAESQGGRVPDFTSVSYRMEIENAISELIDALGMCERILTTPVPRGYSRHTSRFLTVYGLTLPLVLVPHTEMFTAPVVGAVCWGLFSIEEIAYFIEQPFDPEYRQLSLGAYSEKIRQDIERMTLTSRLRRNEESRVNGKTASVDPDVDEVGAFGDVRATGAKSSLAAAAFAAAHGHHDANHVSSSGNELAEAAINAAALTGEVSHAAAWTEAVSGSHDFAINGMTTKEGGRITFDGEHHIHNHFPHPKGDKHHDEKREGKVNGDTSVRHRTVPVVQKLGWKGKAEDDIIAD